MYEDKKILVLDLINLFLHGALSAIYIERFIVNINTGVHTNMVFNAFIGFSFMVLGVLRIYNIVKGVETK